MANTTFSGPVRSENGFEVISKNATTGVVQDRTQDFGLHDARRYYLCENFYQRPAINGDIDQAYTCLLYTSPSPRDKRQSRMPSSA